MTAAPGEGGIGILLNGKLNVISPEEYTAHVTARETEEFEDVEDISDLDDED